MLPLSLLSACAAVLVIPASAAPLSLESSDHQRSTRFLAPSPKQRLTTDGRPASGDAPDLFLLMPRGAAFREADYAVNAASAFTTAVPAQSAEATPAVLATRAVLRRNGSIASSSGSGNKAQTHRPSTDDLAAPVALAAAPFPLDTFDSAPGTGPSTSTLSQPAVDRLLKPDGLSGYNKAFAAPLIQPDTPAPGAPGPEARPQFRNANRTLSQTQMDSTDATPPNAAALVQVDGPNGQVVEISKDADAPPQVNAMGNKFKSDSPSLAVSRNIGTIDSQHDRQGPLDPSRYLSGDQKTQDAQKLADKRESALRGEGVTGAGAVSRVGGEQRAIPNASKAVPNAHNKSS